MKTNVIRRPNRLLLASCLMGLLGGCVSQIPSLKSYLKTGMGLPIAEVQQRMSRPSSYASSIGWQETTYPLDNGNWVYVEPTGEHGKLLGGGPCFVHWEVNPEGIIVGAHTEGEGCRFW